MTQLRNEIRIAATPAAVFAVLDDLEAVQRYNPLVARTRYTSEARSGIGASRHCDFKPKGFSDERVVGWEPDRVHAMEVVRSSWPMSRITWRAELRPEGPGTRLVQHTEYVVKGGPLGAVLDALVMRRKFARILDDILSGLKEEVEGRGRAPLVGVRLRAEPRTPRS